VWKILAMGAPKPAKHRWDIARYSNRSAGETRAAKKLVLGLDIAMLKDVAGRKS
jgi:hypothetical protein